MIVIVDFIFIIEIIGWFNSVFVFVEKGFEYYYVIFKVLLII